MAIADSLPTPAAALFALLRGEQITGVDWDAVGVYAHATGLGALLLQNAQGQLPPLLAARLRLAAQRTDARNTTLITALGELVRACNSRDIALIVLKGAYLAPVVYGNLSLRGMTDVDVLVQPANFPRLQEIMAQLGYLGKHTDPEKGPGIVKHEWTYKSGASTPSSPSSSTTNPYLFADDSFHIEPHTSLTESWFGLRVEMGAAVWDRAIRWECEGVPALALHPIDCLLHVAIHLVFHLLMGRPALLQLYDLRRLLEAFPDLVFDSPASTDPGILNRAQAVGAVAHLFTSLRLAQAAYAAPVPDSWLKRLGAEIPPGQRNQAENLDLPALWSLTQQAPLSTLGQRLRRGLSDRALAAAWARDRREAWRVWSSGLAFHRTDTAMILRQRLALR